jgi:hypothetical protein
VNDSQLIWEAYIENESFDAVILIDLLKSNGFKNHNDERGKDNSFQLSFAWRHGDDYIVVTVSGQGGQAVFIETHIGYAGHEHYKQYVDLDSESKYQDIAVDVLSVQEGILKAARR